VGWHVFVFFCGLLALALCVVVSRPALMRMPAGAGDCAADPGVCHGGVLVVGGIFAPVAREDPWRAHRGGGVGGERWRCFLRC